MEASDANEDCRRRLRNAMPVVESVAYFDHAAVAPLSGPAAEKIGQYADAVSRSGDLVWPEWANEIEACRRVAARILNAPQPSHIAWISNTTQGINFVADGFDWRPGDNMVTLANEFPSNLYPWMHLRSRDVELRQVEPTTNGEVAGAWTVESVLEACDERTRLITVSWVGYASGFRGPIAELTNAAHQRGIRVFLDAIQGLGVFPLDVQATPVDYLAADGHKWMLGPEGAGLFYISPNAIDSLRPMNVGWNSVVDRHNFDHIDLKLRPGADRYEGGTQNVPGVTALGASLSLLEECGLSYESSRIGDTVLENAGELSNWLRSIGAIIRSPLPQDNPAEASGIVSFELPGQTNLKAIQQFCQKRKIPISFRGGRLRASPHAYNNEKEFKRLRDALVAAMM